MTTERRVQANRRNALAATGPRIQEGKANVTRNALKHGVLAREAVIIKEDGREDEDVFNRLLAGL